MLAFELCNENNLDGHFLFSPDYPTAIFSKNNLECEHGTFPTVAQSISAWFSALPPLCRALSRFSFADNLDCRCWNLQILCNHILRSIVCKMLDCLSTQSFTKSRTLRHHCIRTTNPLRNLFLSLPEPFFLEHASGITFRMCLHFQKTVKLRNLEIEYTVFVFVLHSVEDKWIKGLKRFANVALHRKWRNLPGGNGW